MEGFSTSNGSVLFMQRAGVFVLVKSFLCLYVVSKTKILIVPEYFHDYGRKVPYCVSGQL